jgi:hypothetical protein
MHPTAKAARVAGVLYLLTAVIGFFSIYAPRALIIPGDATATASNILVHETLFRLGIAAGLVSSITFIVLAMALYRLLSGVGERLASAMVAFALVLVAVGFVESMSSIVALALFHGADFLAVLDKPQRDALGMLFLGLQEPAVSQISWGPWLFPFGVLVMRSRFLPRILGILLIINSLAYVAAGLTSLVLPGYASLVSRLAIIPEMAGELSIMLWLLIMGAKVGPLAGPVATSAGG